VVGSRCARVPLRSASMSAPAQGPRYKVNVRPCTPQTETLHPKHLSPSAPPPPPLPKHTLRPHRCEQHLSPPSYTLSVQLGQLPSMSRSCWLLPPVVSCLGLRTTPSFCPRPHPDLCHPPPLPLNIPIPPSPPPSFPAHSSNIKQSYSLPTCVPSMSCSCWLLPRGATTR
jgi:hypothetical protein